MEALSPLSPTKLAADAVRAVLTSVAGKPLAVVEREWLALPQAPAPVIHRFGPGIYIREVSVAAGTLAIGHYQRFEQMNVMLKGRVTILRDDGTTSELIAPMCFVGPPGRKIGYVHEDMVWQNIYATTETDVAKLEAMFLDKSEGWLADHAARRLVDVMARAADHDDYHAVLREFGFTHEQVRQQTENTADQIPFPPGGYKVMVADSDIEGKGLFATADIMQGEVIAPGRLGGMRTPAGRYTNHAAHPNATPFRTPNGDIWLEATQPIAGCRGGQPGEEITIDYRQALRLSMGS